MGLYLLLFFESSRCLRCSDPHRCSLSLAGGRCAFPSKASMPTHPLNSPTGNLKAKRRKRRSPLLMQSRQNLDASPNRTHREARSFQPDNDDIAIGGGLCFDSDDDNSISSSSSISSGKNSLLRWQMTQKFAGCVVESDDTRTRIETFVLCDMEASYPLSTFIYVCLCLILPRDEHILGHAYSFCSSCDVYNEQAEAVFSLCSLSTLADSKIAQKERSEWQAHVHCIHVDAACKLDKGKLSQRKPTDDVVQLDFGSNMCDSNDRFCLSWARKRSSFQDFSVVTTNNQHRTIKCSRPACHKHCAHVSKTSLTKDLLPAEDMVDNDGDRMSVDNWGKKWLVDGKMVPNCSSFRNNPGYKVFDSDYMLMLQQIVEHCFLLLLRSTFALTD